jgi:Arc/MetJ family transcription regulator
MRTRLIIDEKLLGEAMALSGAKTKKEAVEVALNEYIKRKKFRRLLELEGKVELSFTRNEFLKDWRKSVLKIRHERVPLH